MPPATGTAPPGAPVPPARGVTGTSARSATASAAATSSADRDEHHGVGRDGLLVGLVAGEGQDRLGVGQDLGRAEGAIEEASDLVGGGGRRPRKRRARDHVEVVVRMGAANDK